MRLSRSILAATCVLAMVLFPASTAAAQVSVWPVVDMVESTDEDEIIPATFPTEDEADKCAYQRSNCPHLEGLTYVDVNVTDELESYENGAKYWVLNDMGVPTWWFVCAFDGPGGPDDCRHGGNYLSGELAPDTETLRVMTIQSPAAEYTVRIDVW